MTDFIPSFFRLTDTCERPMLLVERLQGLKRLCLSCRFLVIAVTTSTSTTLLLVLLPSARVGSCEAAVGDLEPGSGRRWGWGLRGVVPVEAHACTLPLALD